MADEIPQWAVDKARELIRADVPANGGKHFATVSEEAFARYIAEHEEASVDPLEEALADALLTVFEDGFKSWAPTIAEYAPKLRDELSARGLKIVEAN